MSRSGSRSAASSVTSQWVDCAASYLESSTETPSEQVFFQPLLHHENASTFATILPFLIFTFPLENRTFEELTHSDTYMDDMVTDYYEKATSMTDVSTAYLRESSHTRVNLLKHNIPKGPCALCGMGNQKRETVYGCVECSTGGQKYVRLHVVPCFDLWHKTLR